MPPSQRRRSWIAQAVGQPRASENAGSLTPFMPEIIKQRTPVPPTKTSLVAADPAPSISNVSASRMRLIVYAPALEFDGADVEDVAALTAFAKVAELSSEDDIPARKI